ncbi:MAG: sulfite exporter TauE/SafE family protein [Chlamydiota bacterium]|nr:sulfite exporter TauE/SafE family protein [Chlamydiota bacterium]
MNVIFWLPVGFFIIALLYSMVGLGGGSSYIAFLVLAGLPYQQIPLLALLCNIVVSGTAFWHFSRAGHLRIHKVLPFIAGSIPMAYLGATIRIEQHAFSFILGSVLLVTALRMMIPVQTDYRGGSISGLRIWIIGLPVGMLLGLLAGLVGIGGGIFLGPILILLGWAHAKEAAAATSFVVLVNSVSGFLGQLHKGGMESMLIIPLVLSVLIAGQIGARLGAYRLSRIHIQRMIAVLLLTVSIKLLSQAMRHI